MQRIERILMTVDKRLNVKLDQQIALWLQQEEMRRQLEREMEARPVRMEIVKQ